MLWHIPSSYCSSLTTLCRSPLPWEAPQQSSPASSEESVSGGAHAKNGVSYDGASFPHYPIAQTHYGQGAGPPAQPASMAYAQSRGLHPRAVALGSARHGGNSNSLVDQLGGPDSIGRLVLASDYDHVASSEEDEESDASLATDAQLEAERQYGDFHLEDFTGEDDNSSSVSKKKASLKKFMSKLKRPSKDHTVTVPHPE